MFFEFLNFFFMFSYITGVNSFPRTLTKEEEFEALTKYKTGDAEAKNTLILHNLRLVAYVAKKYNNHAKEAEDLISVGTIGLIKAVTHFDMDKGTKFVTYAAKCIDNTI